MAFEITSDTVVKILVRRGLEVERLDTLLSEGELGLSVDSRRLFIGDGYTLGGTPVGNINFGVVGNVNDVRPYAQPGDMAFSQNLNYVFYNNNWNVTSPALYSEPQIGYTLEYSPAPGNALRFAQGGLGDGLLIDYSIGSTGDKDYTIQNVYGQLNFDARFLSLCAFRSVYAPSDGPRVGSFYFGNIFTSTIKDNLSTTVNIEKNLSINDHVSAYQLKLDARNPDYNSSLIGATSGNLFITSKDSIYLGTGTNSGSGLVVKGNNVTVFGNLSVLGDIAYIDSIVSVTSALSVVNAGTGPALVVNQKGTQPVANFQDDGTTALFIADGGNVGIGTAGPAEKLTVVGNISSNGTLFTTSVTSRGLDLIHSPANDGTNPILRFGESTPGSTTLSGFSGAFASYDEITNVFGISSVFAPAMGIPAIAIDRNSNIGIGVTVPAEKLTVSGNISSNGTLFTQSVTSRGLDLIHTPANDGFNPILRFGESDYGTNNNGFSGVFMSYDESTNVFGISSVFAPAMGLPALSIDRTGSVTLSSITLSDSANITLNTATGTKIGTATTQKLGFYNATPVIQPSSVNQAAVTNTPSPSAGGFGYTSAQATAIITLVNEIRTTLVNLGLMKGSA